MLRTATEQRKPERVFFPVQRVLRGETSEGHAFRVPEGYTYVNAWVGDGINLTRASMIGASDDYMRWGAVREMHQPSAVGTAIGSVEVDGETLPLGVSWDETGAFLRAMVVDPDAIAKLDAGVYRGFSVCVVPTVMRGVDCIECKWIENSLVDRPADSDCPITLIRAEGVDVNAAHTVIRYWDDNDNWVSGPFLFDTRVKGLRQEDVLDDLRGAFYALLESWHSLVQADQTSDLAVSFDQFAAFVKSDVLGEVTTERAAKIVTSIKRLLSDRDRAEQEAGMLTRVQDGQTEAVRLRGEVQTLAQARDAVTVERDAARAEAETLRAEVARLGALPDPAQAKPLKFAPAERTFAANGGAETATGPEATLRAELTTLEQTLRDEPDENKRRAGVMRIMQIKTTLQTQADAGNAAGGQA